MARLVTLGAPVEENPSCLQTTMTSLLVQESSHTVPHVPLKQTSTRPSSSLVPLTSLTSPSMQFAMFKNYNLELKFNYMK